MVGLRPCKCLIAQHGKSGATAGVLAAGPAQGRIEIVAAVHEDRAGLDPLAEGFGGREFVIDRWWLRDLTLTVPIDLRSEVDA